MIFALHYTFLKSRKIILMSFEIYGQKQRIDEYIRAKMKFKQPKKLLYLTVTMLYIYFDGGSNHFPCAQQEEAKHNITISINLSFCVIKKTKKSLFLRQTKGIHTVSKAVHFVFNHIFLNYYLICLMIKEILFSFYVSCSKAM